MASPVREDAHRMEGVVRCPFVLERFDVPVPYLALRILLAKGVQFTFEVILTDQERLIHVNVVFVYAILSDLPHFFLS